MVGLAVSLVKDLRERPDGRAPQVRRRRPSRPAVVTGVTEHGDDFVLQVEKDPTAE